MFHGAPHQLQCEAAQESFPDDLDRLAPEGSAPHALTQEALVSEDGVLDQAPPGVA